MKLFNTSDVQVVTECQSIFNFRLPSVIIPDRCEIFRVKCESREIRPVYDHHGGVFMLRSHHTKLN